MEVSKNISYGNSLGCAVNVIVANVVAFVGGHLSDFMSIPESTAPVTITTATRARRISTSKLAQSPAISARNMTGVASTQPTIRIQTIRSGE